MPDKTLVVAIGGNSLIKDAKHQTVPDQDRGARRDERAHRHDRSGWLARRDRPRQRPAGRASSCAGPSSPPTSSTRCRSTCAAPTRQGAIGYELQQNLGNDFRPAAASTSSAVTVVTQVEVASDDPAFQHPTKPIGSFMDDGARDAAARRATAGSSSRTPAAAGAASSPRRGRCGSSSSDAVQRAPRRRLRGHHRRRRRHPRRRRRRRATCTASPRSSTRTSPRRCSRPRSGPTSSRSPPRSSAWRSTGASPASAGSTA